jgi:hypothetical protein
VAPMKIFTISHVPDELANAWLQHLRNFDFDHPGCHFEVGIDAPDMPMSKVIEALKVNPALTIQDVIERGK